MQNFKRRSEIDFAALCSDIVWIVEDDQIVDCNQSWSSFSGLGRELQSFPPKACVSELDYARFAKAWRRTKKLHQSFRLELRLKAKSGKFFWHRLSMWPVLQEPGMTLESARWFVVCTNIDTLKNVQNMFQLVLDNIPISIFWKDRASRYLGCNQVFAKDVGKTNPSEVIGCEDYDNPATKEENDEFVKCDRRVMETGLPEYKILEPQHRPDGKTAWLETSKIPLRDAGGQVIGVLGMYEDITERVAKEQQRLDFIATLTHDLKNPLLATNRIIDYWIKGEFGSVSDKQAKILEQIGNSNQDLVELIKKIATVHKYSSDTDLQFEHSNITELIGRVVDDFSVVAGTRQIALVCAQTLQIDAQIDVQSITRLLKNLLDNAVKFSSAGGTITVTTSLGHDKTFKIQISDTGSGISPEDLPKLFTRFGQGAAGKSFSHGSGLGLFVCKQIVEFHKGTIVCNSAIGNGTSFTVTLPLSQ